MSAPDDDLTPEEQAAYDRQGERLEQERAARKRDRVRPGKPSYAGGFFYEMPGGAMWTHPDDR